MVILVTGANGQLGQSINFISDNYPDTNFIFCNSSELDITNLENCQSIFKKHKPNFCINTAAYTAVDKAESEKEKATAINVFGAQNLAQVCKNFDTVLLHVSTDFVFDGNKQTPYTELDNPNPTGVYGQTKLDGEKAIQDTWNKHFIIRTSWVYSQFGNNFMKTMLRLANEREELSVVNDQIGTPTNAIDLAEVLIKIVQFCQTKPVEVFGVYNFSNEGSCSWFDFAQEIFKQQQLTINLNAIPTSAFPTPAKRPKYSVLDKSNLKKVFSIAIDTWQKSLVKALKSV
jgi:dTDP-4-dehydrorhamnose reductase